MLRWTWRELETYCFVVARQFSTLPVRAWRGSSAGLLNHYPQYIKSWLRALKDDNKFIISAASKAQKAADYALESSAAASQPQAIAAE